MDPRENPYSDKEDEYNYQRVINEDRARKIEKFIIKRIEAHYLLVDMPVIFPTSMIIAFDSDKPVIVDENGIVSLDSIPYGTYCVDGQHRLYSMQELYKRSSEMKPLSTKISNEEIRTYISDYKFNTTILLNFDMWEQAQVFANVNFNQKPVTKSLYYDIYGIYYYENDEKRNVWNELYLCHILVDKLNRDKKSPLYNHIKMLGIGNGYISQAFMGDSICRHLTPRGIWYRRAHEALNNYDNDFGFIYNELLGYFKAISTVFASYWPPMQEKTNLCKTTGIGAMMRLLGLLHRKYSNKFDVQNVEMDMCFNLFQQEFSKIPQNKYEYLFSTDENGKGAFRSGGGSGYQAQLFRELKVLLKLD